VMFFFGAWVNIFDAKSTVFVYSSAHKHHLKPPHNGIEFACHFENSLSFLIGAL
jgi:hypothetical protein